MEFVGIAVGTTCGMGSDRHSQLSQASGGGRTFRATRIPVISDSANQSRRIGATATTGTKDLNDLGSYN